MTHGRGDCKNKERLRQYAQTIKNKNPTLLRLKRKFAKEENVELETSLDFISLYAMGFAVSDKSRKKQIHKDFNGIRKVIGECIEPVPALLLYA